MTEHDLVALAQRVHDAERMNFGATSTRDERNANWERIVGIAHHGHPTYNPTPDPRWHCKRADAGRPPSDDVAVLMPSREFWDFIPSSGAAGYRFEVSGSHGALPGDQIVFAPRVPDGGSVVAPPPVASPLWTAAHRTLVEGLLQQHTPNAAGDLAFVRKVAEQFAHSFPAEGWGLKRADPTRPVSNNVVARQTSTGLVGFRVVPAALTPAQIDLRGQALEPVGPLNHLGVVIVPPPPIDPPIELPPVVDPDLVKMLAAVLDTCLVIDGKVDQQRKEVLAAVRGQSYGIDASADLFGRKTKITGTIRPETQE